MTRTEMGGLLKEAAAKLRAVTQDRDAKDVELAGLHKTARAEKIADRMMERGLIAPESRTEKVAELQEREDLDVLEQAVELSTSEELAKVAAVGESPAGAGLDPLSAFLLGAVSEAV